MKVADTNLEHFLATLRTHLTQRVKPIAAIIDHDSEALANVFSELNRLFLCKLWFNAPLGTMPRPLVSDVVLREIAASSGALAFTAAQFMGACRRIQMSTNTELSHRIATDVAAGQLAIGIGTTHLKPGPCVLNARKIQGGFAFNGLAPWVTGHGIFAQVLVAARVGINGSVIALLDFLNPTGQMKISAPFDLNAMNSTNTVSIAFKNYFVSDENIVAEIPDNSPASPPLPPFYSFQLGCARAALQLAGDNLHKYRNTNMATHVEKLIAELARCTAECEQIFYITERHEFLTRSNKARTWLDSILMRSIYAALPLVGGQSILKGSEIARLAGEATVYAISLQSEEIISSRLAALTGLN